MIRRYSGKDLAKVLIYYGLVGEIYTSSFKIVCPFHDDANPSMTIDLEDGTFFCFGCGLSGNAYKFVQYANPELNELQCCVMLEKIIHSNEVKDIQVRYKRKRRKGNKKALMEAEDYYYGLRQTDWNKVEDTDEVKTLKYMEDRGFNARALNVAGCRANYNVSYPFLFPILDNGEFKGWVGRTTNPYVEKKRKYLYNEGFHKRDTLCGTYCKNSIPLICEGYMDYLSIKTRGHIKNVVATLGWHMSDEQANKLKQQGITTVISALDNDPCGIRGTEVLKKYFNVIRFPYPEGVKDTGEMTVKQFNTAKREIKRRVREFDSSKP